MGLAAVSRPKGDHPGVFGIGQRHVNFDHRVEQFFAGGAIAQNVVGVYDQQVFLDRKNIWRHLWPSWAIGHQRRW